ISTEAGWPGAKTAVGLFVNSRLEASRTPVIVRSLFLIALFSFHFPNAVPISRRLGSQIRAAPHESAAGTISKFSYQFLKLRQCGREVAEKVFVIGGFVAAAQLGIVLGRAEIFALEEFHRGALAFHDDAVHQAPRALLEQLREGLARDQQSGAVV